MDRCPASIIVVQHWVEELKRLVRRNSAVLTGEARRLRF